MASVSVEKAGGGRTGALLVACVAEHGSAAHPYFGSDALRSGGDSGRNLADAVHFLAALHGRFPSVVELAGLRSIEPAARPWLSQASDAMTAERAFLAKLAGAVGPTPSTPGSAGSETAVISQQSAVSTLAQSDRRGCALGAALAFALDWLQVRALLDITAIRLGMAAPFCDLGNAETLLTIADETGAAAPAVSRAMLFGAQQFALQHHGLWDLLEARQQARRGS